MIYDIYTSEGHYIGGSGYDDAKIAASFFMGAPVSPWQIEIESDANGGLVARFQDIWVRLKPVAPNE